MWYLAEILFAEPKPDNRNTFHCESCDVVIQAATALEAHRKALEWGKCYAQEPPAAMAILGVSNLTTIGEEMKDGTEICGRYFEAPDVWAHRTELIPSPEMLKAVQWERSDKSIGELLES